MIKFVSDLLTVINSMFLFISTLALCAGFLLDLLLGDPTGWPHLVRGIGWLILVFERAFYSMRNKRLGGLFLVICVLSFSLTIPAVLLILFWKLSPWAFFVAETLFCWQLLALKSLKDESRIVYDRLVEGDLPAARSAVSMIVGRDTATLDESGVVRAAVETVAENASDGEIAPLFYLAFGGALFGLFYKSVNTMDSMIGYQNERYQEFGYYAAKLDDILNHLPSRLSALLMILAAWFCRYNTKNAFRIWWRDRNKHKSPNAAQTEAVLAGALDIQLGGEAHYSGRLHKKPTIGDANRPIEPNDILLSHRLLSAASFLMFFFALLIRGCLYVAL